MEFTLWKLIREDQKNGDGIVFNAPRPLAGDKVWQGEFIHGYFYSSVSDVNEKYTRDMMKTNLSLDAYVIEYVTLDQALTMSRNDYVKQGYEDRFSEFSPKKLEELFITNFENKLCQSTIEL